MSQAINKRTKAALLAASIFFIFLIPHTLYAQLPYLPQKNVSIPDQSIG